MIAACGIVTEITKEERDFYKKYYYCDCCLRHCNIFTVIKNNILINYYCDCCLRHCNFCPYSVLILSSIIRITTVIAACGIVTSRLIPSLGESSLKLLL